MECISVLKFYDSKDFSVEIYYEVGAKANEGIVERIQHHKPKGEGDQHYSEIHFKNGSKTIIYRPDEVKFKETELVKLENFQKGFIYELDEYLYKTDQGENFYYFKMKWKQELRDWERLSVRKPDMIAKYQIYRR